MKNADNRDLFIRDKGLNELFDNGIVIRLRSLHSYNDLYISVLDEDNKKKIFIKGVFLLLDDLVTLNIGGYCYTKETANTILKKLSCKMVNIFDSLDSDIKLKNQDYNSNLNLFFNSGDVSATFSSKNNTKRASMVITYLDYARRAFMKNVSIILHNVPILHNVSDNAINALCKDMSNLLVVLKEASILNDKHYDEKKIVMEKFNKTKLV